MTQTKKQSWLERRHPSFFLYEKALEFYRQAYIGGPEYRQGKHLFQFPKEKKDKFDLREKRASRYNHVKKVVDLLNSYMFKKLPSRKKEGNAVLEKFWDNVDGRGTHADKWFKKFNVWLWVYGYAYIVVDKPPVVAQTAQQEQDLGLFPYIYWLSPNDVLDINFDGNGNILWALVRETYRDAADPHELQENHGLKKRYRLWMPNQWELWAVDKDGNPYKEDEGPISIGRVPIVKAFRDGDNTDDPYTAPSLIQEIAELDRDIYNKNSELDVLITGQTFSTLTIPFKGLGELETFYKQWAGKLGVEEILPFSDDSKFPPSFISPDASQGELILKVIKDKINQIYRLAGISGEVGEVGDNARLALSGVSKAYDFQKLNNFLATEADNLEEIEKDVARLVLQWMGQKPETLSDDAVDYPESFEIQSLVDELLELERVAASQVSQLLIKEMKKAIVRKHFPKLEDKVMDEILAEIDAGDDALPENEDEDE